MMTLQEKYKDIIHDDLIEPIRPLLERGAYKIRSDGRIETEMRQVSETPWVHIRQDAQKQCGLWHKVWFDVYGLLPSYCTECWKVVVRPVTLADLFALMEILLEQDVPSKCGIERRYSVDALYGGYLYNSSLTEGLACEAWAKDLIHSRIGTHVNVFLKRACTEFEHKFGDSRKWEITPEQKALERRLESLFVLDRTIHTQGPEMQRHVMANWVRFAYAHGDPTAHGFMSEPLYPPYVRYIDE